MTWGCYFLSSFGFFFFFLLNPIRAILDKNIPGKSTVFLGEVHVDEGVVGSSGANWRDAALVAEDVLASHHLWPEHGAVSQKCPQRGCRRPVPTQQL